MPMATTAARIGMIHTTEIRKRFERATLACGKSLGSFSSAMDGLAGIDAVPDQTRIKGFGREHGQHHHGGEKQHTLARRHRHQRLQLHQGHGEGVDEHIEHRPSADDYDQPIEPCALTAALDRTLLYADQQIGERHQLAQGNHDARDQHQERERPRSRGVEKRHAAQDGVTLGARGCGRVEHRQHVGRNVADGRGDEQRPGGPDRAMAADLELLATAAAEARLAGAGRVRQQVAGLAGHEAGASSGQRWSLHRAASIHSIRRQSSRRSTLTTMAGISRITAPNAYIPIPGSTVASSAILTNATRMPSITTSSIDHTCRCPTQRNISAAHGGTEGSRTAINNTNMNDTYPTGAMTAQNATSALVIR